MLSAQDPASTRRRTTKACDFCHRRGRKCRPAEDCPTSCQTCLDHGVSCTSNRVAAKRGVKPRLPTRSIQEWTFSGHRHGSRAVLQVLIDVFFSDVYPVICTIHESTLRRRWDAGTLPNDRASYAMLLAMCALASQRIISGASPAPDHVPASISIQSFLEDSLKAVSGSHHELRDLESLQAVHLLCVTAMETGNASLYHQLMGLYHTIVADQGLGDERRWPSDLTGIDREALRRLFWHMYRLEVHTALILGHLIRCPESQIAVEYPNDPSFDRGTSNIGMEWLTGWNFVTDLYRGLEHLLVQFRSRRRGTVNHGRMNLETSSDHGGSRSLEMLESFNLAYEALPMRFKEPMDMSNNIERNRCVYQTANIICTYHLLKMLSYSSGNVTFRDACQTVLHLVEKISAIPEAFLRSMSLAMVQELSGFGHLLGSFIGKALSTADYLQLKSVMRCMYEFFDCLTSSIPAAAEAAQRLRQYEEKADAHMQQSHSQQFTPDLHEANANATYVNTGALSVDVLGDMLWSESFMQDFDQQLFDQTFLSFSVF